MPRPRQHRGRPARRELPGQHVSAKAARRAGARLEGARAESVLSRGLAAVGPAPEAPKPPCAAHPAALSCPAQCQAAPVIRAQVEPQCLAEVPVAGSRGRGWAPVSGGQFAVLCAWAEPGRADHPPSEPLAPVLLREPLSAPQRGRGGGLLWGGRGRGPASLVPRGSGPSARGAQVRDCHQDKRDVIKFQSAR